MPKITLPPKVKCWRCEDGQVAVRVGEVEPGPGIPDILVGISKYDFEPCDCSDGERYVFDDLAAAVEAAGLNYEVGSLSDPTAKGYRHYGRVNMNSIELIPGPNPTTALLMAIEKFNEEAK